jgi:tRNA pseudouridine-54 N-methylase
VVCMREFLLYSRMGKTEGHWSNLHDAGRLDIVMSVLCQVCFCHMGCVGM